MVTVVMHGNLRRFLPDAAVRTTLDVPAGMTIEEVLTRIGAEKDTWLVTRNQVVAERDAVLAPGDLLDCFEPVAGGSAARGESILTSGGRPCRFAT